MKVTTKSQYAIQALLHLVMHNEDSVVKIQQIAEAEKIPQKYLEQILLTLKSVGLIE